MSETIAESKPAESRESNGGAASPVKDGVAAARVAMQTAAKMYDTAINSELSRTDMGAAVAKVWPDIEQIIQTAGDKLTPSEQLGWPEPLSFAEVLAEAAKEAEWIIKGLFAVAHVVLIYALPKMLKSMFVEALCIGLANGLWPAGCFEIGRKYRVGYISWEDGSWRLSSRALRFMGQMGDAAIPDIYPCDRAPDMIFPRDTLRAIEWIKMRGYEVLVLDTQDYTQDLEDEKSYAGTREWRKAIRQIATVTRCAIILITHSPKNAKQRSNTQERAVGSIGFAGLADDLLELSRTESGDLLLESCPKDAPPGRWRIKYDPDSDKPWTVTLEEPETRPFDRVLGELRRLSQGGGWTTAKEIAAGLGVSDDVARRCLEDAGDAVEKRKRAGRGGGKEYRMSGGGQ